MVATPWERGRGGGGAHLSRTDCLELIIIIIKYVKLTETLSQGERLIEPAELRNFAA